MAFCMGCQGECSCYEDTQADAAGCCGNILTGGPECEDCPGMFEVSAEAPEETFERRLRESLPPPAPGGFEWVLMPARPFLGTDQKSPGEKGHYSDLSPEPIQVSEAWGLDGLEHSALKYLARYRKKNGIEDLEKVKFYADMMIAREKREGRA
jgi:hypothetical protein